MAAERGEVVALTTLDSEPRLLVTAVDDDSVEGVLLADLERPVLDRLAATVGDREGRRNLTATIRDLGDAQRFVVPHGEYRHLDGPGIRGCTPFRREA